MALRTFVIFVDGREEIMRDDFVDLEEAITDAVDAAERFGSDPGDGHGPPDWVCVKRGDNIEITLKVFRGGLTKNGR